MQAAVVVETGTFLASVHPNFSLPLFSGRWVNGGCIHAAAVPLKCTAADMGSLPSVQCRPGLPPPLCVCTALSETPTTPFLCTGVGLHARAVINRQRQVRKQRAHHDSLVPYITFSLGGNENYFLRSMYNNTSYNWDHYFPDLKA